MKQLLVKEIYEEKKEFKLSGKTFRYLIKVRRVSTGEIFRLLTVDKIPCNAEVIEVSKEYTILRMLQIVDENRTKQDNGISIILYQSLLKGKKIDSIFRKAVECGVSKVIPINSQNCVINFQERQKNAKIERWQKIVNEAAQQSGNIKPFIVDFRDNIEDEIKNISGPVIVFHQTKLSDLSIHETVHKIVNNKKIESISILIGPEGGFCDKELELFQKRGYYTAWMGPTVMRAETASISALSIISIMLLEKNRWCLAEKKE